MEREKILNILNVVRFAPSGGNSQGISYLVVDDKEKLRQVSLLTQQWITEADKADGSRRFRFYKIYIDRNMSLGIDVVLRAAPVLIAGLAKRSLENGFSNTRFSLAYAELYVTTQGLASCWAGFFEMAGLADYKPMKELLNIPDDQVITGGIILGYPKNTYHRLVDRNPLKVSFLG
ncbi:MAG: nitroreductase family protein [Bacteroidetes bacterium]|nr:nitroreductase family protein [Bacteroidota bacterium]